MDKCVKVFMVLFLFSFAIMAKGQNGNEAEVLKVLELQRQSWNKGDWQGYMAGYWQSDSLMFIGKKGPTYGWQKTMDNYQKSYPNKDAMGHLVFDVINVHQLSSKYCYVVGKWLLERLPENTSGSFTLLFKKINGQWLIVSDHSS